MTIDQIDKSIIGLIQGDLPLEAHPFEALSEQIGISEAEVVARIGKLQTTGAMRRWGAVLRHQQAGYKHNALVAWKVEAADSEETGKRMSASQEISHCYLRKVPPEFPYNLFTMIHARSEEELISIIQRIANDNKLNDYVIVKSIREFKKASMVYV